MNDDHIIRTASGSVRGTLTNRVRTHRGVPYAAPPVGDKRFGLPEPVPGWLGIRDAISPGATAPQQASGRFAGIDMFPITGAEWRRGNDYLTLNVWSPAHEQGCPVMVYIHGGGLVLGTKDAAVYDGRNFARDGAVAVSINYRLGVEGFLAIPGAPTNLGLRDMLAALQWVQDNIEAFGGDPSNVTVWGESGGGIAVSCLVASPLSAGLFSRAIIQSGNGSAVYPIAIAERMTRRVAEVLKISPDLDGFRAADPERALHALRRASRPGAVDMRDESGFAPGFGFALLNPVFGDDLLPQHPLAALANGAGREIDLLIGTTQDEANFMTAPTRLILAPLWLARLILRRLVPDADALIEKYRRQDQRARGGAILSRILGDLAFRGPARDYAAAHQGRTHFYEFDWHSPASGGRLGASHGTDLGFVFDTLPAVSGPHQILGMNPPQDLADRIHATWLEFATNGNAPWPEYDGSTRVVHRLAEGVSMSEAPLLVSATAAPGLVGQR